MNDCHADCLERPLSRGFRELGKLIARNPWCFVIVPVVLSVGLGVGLCFLEQRQIDKLEELFTPEGGISKSQRDFIKMHFPINDSGQFSSERLYTEGTFASLIVVSMSNNVLNRNTLQELRKLDAGVRNLTSMSGLNFNQLCAQFKGFTCLPANPVLTMMQNLTKDLLSPYPSHHQGVFMGLYIGGVTLGPDNVLLKAKALRLLYYLREDNNTMQNSMEWLDHFMKSISHLIKEMQFRFTKVYHSTSISLQKEFEGSIETAIPLFSITYVVTILFSVVSCASLDNVRNKIWVTTFGVISPGLAILTSFGLLLLCRVPFARTVVNAPFLILGIGVDNMYILISCWKQTKISSPVEERMAQTYQEAAVSITITTLTDVLAFYIGIMSHFPSVQSFCIYTGTALVFCYIYCITFFGALLALNGMQENNKRHWLVCRKVKEEKDVTRGCLYNACCVGGAFDTSRGTETEHPITVFFYKYYGPILAKPSMKILALLAYILYLSTSIYGCFQIQEGIDIRNLAKANSSLTRFYDIEALYFSKYGPRIMVVVTSETNYWDMKTQEVIESCMQSLENNQHIAKEYSVSWLRAYEDIADRKNFTITTKKKFLQNLSQIYAHFPDFKQDIKMEGGKIKTSRFFIQAINVVDIDNAKDMLTHLRGVTDNCSIEMIVYHPLFIYVDQYAVIIHNAIQNIMVTAVVMLVISILFIPNPLCALWVTMDIASIIAGVIGYMSFWKVNLDSISMINLVICIGFSVDFSAHIVYACVSSPRKNVHGKVIDALHVVGYPILQGALSTILGIAALTAAESYIFRTFFQIMLLVTVFGALHGLVFMPVFLVTVGAFRMSCYREVYPEEQRGEDLHDLPPAAIYRVNPPTIESKDRKADFSLPGYTSCERGEQTINDLEKECYCMSWQGNTYSVSHTKDGLSDSFNIVEYRKRMLKVYLEHKED
ncbi:patched domain-containing protein 3-like [Hyperolius riggenbachi]|uniref:patched domain-containing protein 3-like n=1 Tax=Hyperolius riggenbachi TaxID=752182 RepID=UPI0035A2D6A6